MSNSNQPFTPRAGSLAQRVIDHLTTNGGTLNAVEIHEQFGGALSAVATQLRKATDAGFLLATKQGKSYAWSLPEAGAVSETDETEPMLIGAWSDGDVTVKGLAVADDGTVIFTAVQISQLISHLTRPLHPQTAVQA